MEDDLTSTHLEGEISFSTDCSPYANDKGQSGSLELKNENMEIIEQFIDEKGAHNREEYYVKSEYDDFSSLSPQMDEGKLRSSELEESLQEETERQHKRHLCEYSAKRKAELKNHIGVVRSNLKQHKCHVMAEFFDNDKLIAVVQLYPALWDKGHPDYADKQKKENAWRAVMGVVWGEEEVESWDISKKNLHGKDIQKKWKHLRNSFAREVAKRKKMKSGSGRSWKTYIYFEQMSFLLRNMDHAEVHSNLTDLTENDELQNDCAATNGSYQHPTPIISSSRIRKSGTLQDSSALAEIISESLRWRQQREDSMDRDPDRLFLLSLLEDFRSVPAENKSQVKIALISAIEDVKMPKTVQQQSHLHNFGQFPPFDSRSSLPPSQQYPVPSSSAYQPLTQSRVSSSYHNKLLPTPASRQHPVTVTSPTHFSETNSECSDAS